MQAKVLRKINNLHFLIYRMRFQEFLRFSMSHAKEHHIDIVAQLCGKKKIIVANQILVYRRYGLACIAFTIYKADTGIRVLREQTNQLSTGVASPANNSYPDLFFH